MRRFAALGSQQNIVEHTLEQTFAQMYTQIQTLSKVQAQIRFSSHHQILFLIFLISMPPNSGACATAHLSLMFSVLLTLNLSYQSCSTSSITEKLISPSTMHKISVLASIQRRAPQCRNCMPRTGSERRLLEGPAWADRGLGRIKGHQHVLPFLPRHIF